MFMPKRRGYKKLEFRIKLRTKTVYTIFSVGLILLGILFFLSFSGSGDSFLFIKQLLESYFGGLSVLFPFVPILLGFLFLRLKMGISRPNVTFGYLLFFITLCAITKNGSIGGGIFQTLADMLTSTGSYLVILAGLFVSVIVFFDTSLDEIMQALSFAWQNIYRFFPKQLFSFFKTSRPMLVRDNNKQMSIKGGQKDIPPLTAKPADSAVSATSAKKDTHTIISDKLVSNMLATSG